jgi:hypothetical protein
MQDGMVELQEAVEVTTPTSWGGWRKDRFIIGIKVGGAIPYAVRSKISERVKALVSQHGKFDTVGGSAWLLYGLKDDNSI